MFKSRKSPPDASTEVQGHNSSEVARICGVSLRQLQWWDERKVVSPRQDGHKRIYLPEEVVEISVIAELRRKGFSLQKIRRVMRFLQRDMGRRLERGAVFVVGHSPAHGRQVHLPGGSLQPHHRPAEERPAAHVSGLRNRPGEAPGGGRPSASPPNPRRRRPRAKPAPSDGRVGPHGGRENTRYRKHPASEYDKDQGGVRLSPTGDAMKTNRNFIIVAIVAAAALLAPLYGPGIRARAASTSGDDLDRSIHAVASAYALIEQNFADAVSPERAFYQGAIPGMLHTLDPHSNFVDPAEYREMERRQHAQYFGVGMEIYMDGPRVVVMRPLPGSPALNAGLRRADIIVGVGDKDATGLDSAAVADLLRGPARHAGARDGAARRRARSHRGDDHARRDRHHARWMLSG